MKTRIEVTSSNIHDVAERIMVHPSDLSKAYLKKAMEGKALIIELEEEEPKKATSFADRFNEDISED